MKIGIALRSSALLICLLFATSLRADLSQAEAMEVGESFRSKVIQAVNLKNAAEVASYFDENAILIFGNAQIVRTRANIEAYMQSPYLEEDVKISRFVFDSFEIDSGVVILGDNSFILTGTSVYRLIFSKTKEIKFSSRWLAVMHRTNDLWKIASFQGTVNVFDNPLIDKITRIFYIICVISFFFGVILTIMWKRVKRVKSP